MPCVAQSGASPSNSYTLTGIPGKLTWKNHPASFHIEGGNQLTISAGPKTDWFVDPFNGKIANTGPVLLFSPGKDYVLSAKVSVSFKTKWDAGAFVVYADEHHWAKLALEYSPDNQPTMVTVVTRGYSDDCNSIAVSGNEVYLQIARTGNTYVFYSSIDKKKWNILRTFYFDTVAEARVGFAAQSPAGDGATAKFTEIQYAKGKTKNIYTGQ